MATATMTRESTKKAMNIKLRPLDDRVIVQQSEAEERTAGGIVLPDSAREKPSQGKVIATGPGKVNERTGERMKMALSVGDRVYYGKYSGNPIEIDGDKYVILRESDVLAVQE